MEIALAVQIADGALTMLEKLAPVIAEAAKTGQITPEQQTALKARVDALRGHAAFSGPEWQVEP